MAFTRNRKSGFTRQGGVVRRETLWLGGSFLDTGIATSSTPAVLTSLNAAALALRPFTVIRSRGLLHLHSDQVAATEHQQIAYAAAVVSDQSVGIGVTAVPTPVVDNSSDLWFLFETMFNAFDFGSGIGFDANSGNVREIDSRAMRKVEDGQDIITVMETTANSNGVFLQSFVRMLIKLH